MCGEGNRRLTIDDVRSEKEGEQGRCRALRLGGGGQHLAVCDSERMFGA